MNRKTWIRIGIVMMITCVICFSDWSFAADADPQPKMRTIAWLFNFVVSILAWIWALFAKLAGEFFTNNWVYGEALGLDALFWQYWNITKNIANFGLGFYFIYIIFKGLIGQGKEDIVKNIKNKILWIIVAGVGIQASWFLTAAVVDVSTITLVAAGSLPAQLISQNDVIEQDVYKSMSGYFEGSGLVYSRIDNLFAKDAKSTEFLKSSFVRLEEGVSRETFFDSLVPNAESIAGPLYYMGYSILKTSELNTLKLDNARLGSSILNLIIQGGTTIVYSIEMAVLCVLALMRLLYLWMFIVLSPIVVLLSCIKASNNKDKIMELSFIKGLMEQVNIKSFLLNVFKPTIIVLGIGLAMIFTTLMNGVINKNENGYNDVDLGGVKVSTSPLATTEAEKDEKIFASTIEGGVIKFTIGYVGKGLLDFIMSIITVILVYMIIKVAVQMGKGTDFVSKGINKLQGEVGDAITSLPVIPVPGHDENGVGTTSFVTWDGFKSLPEQKFAFMQSSVNKSTSDQVDEVMEKWGFINQNSLKEGQKAEIRNIIGDKTNKGLGGLERVKDYVNTSGFKTDEGRGLTLNPNASDQFWTHEFENWLNNTNAEDITGSENFVWKKMVEWWNRNTGEGRTLERMFRDPDNRNAVAAYATFFGLSGVTKWDNLVEKDISSKNDTKGADISSQSNPSQSGGEDEATATGETDVSADGTSGSGGDASS